MQSIWKVKKEYISAKRISSKSWVNGIYFCGTLMEILLMLFTDTSFTYLSYCNGRPSKICCYQTHLLPAHKSSARTAGCKRGEKAKSYLLGLSLILQQRFCKPVLSLQLHNDHKCLEPRTPLGWQQFMRTMQQKWERPLAQSLNTVTAPSCPGLALNVGTQLFHSVTFSQQFF